MKELTPYQSIKLLNIPGKQSRANIITGICKHKDKTDYSIRISDCKDTVLLHGNLDRDDSVKNALHKIDTIISELEKMKVQINKIK